MPWSDHSMGHIKGEPRIIVWEYWCTSCTSTVQTAEKILADEISCPVCLTEPMVRGKIIEQHY